MKGLKSILFGAVIFGLAGCSDKPVIVKEIKRGNADLIFDKGRYFLKGKKFDFITDEEHAKKFNGSTSASIRYEITWEYIKNGSVDRYGNKTDLWINKDRRLINAWPSDKNGKN